MHQLLNYQINELKDQELQNVFLFKLDTAVKYFRKYKNRVFKEKQIDITSDQWILLKNIHEEEGINQTELANKSRKESAAVTRTLDLLEKKQWIIRGMNPSSRRVHNLYCTKEGREMVQRIIPIALEIRKTARLDITDQEIKLLNSILDRIAKNLE